MNQTLKQRIARAQYVYGPTLGLSAMCAIAAALELVCGLMSQTEIADFVAFPAAALFSVIALCMVWSVIRDERRYA